MAGSLCGISREIEASSLFSGRATCVSMARLAAIELGYRGATIGFRSESARDCADSRKAGAGIEGPAVSLGIFSGSDSDSMVAAHDFCECFEFPRAAFRTFVHFRHNYSDWTRRIAAQLWLAEETQVWSQPSLCGVWSHTLDAGH